MFSKIAQKLAGNEQLVLIKRVFADNFWQYRYKYALAIFYMSIGAAATGALAFLMRDVVNTVLRGTDEVAIYMLGMVIIVIFITKGLATYGNQVIMSKVGNSLIASLRKRVFGHVVSLPISYFDRTTLGEIFTRISSGANSAVVIISSIVTSVGRDFLTLIALGFVMFYQAPYVSLAAVLTGPLIIGQLSRLVRKSKVHSREQLNISAEVSKIDKEAITGVMVIKTYNLEDALKEQMARAMEQFEIRANKLAKLVARTSPLMESLGGIVIGLVILAAGWLSVQNPEYPGQMMSFITAFLLAYDPAKRLARLRVSLEPALVGIQYMYELIDNEKPEHHFLDKPNLEINKGNIRFEDVSFEYTQELPVLHGVSLYADKGEKVALVGVSGAGKSTIFKLLLGLYKAQSGKILIDGQEVTDFNLQSVRKHIAYVGQDSYVFTGTVLENIKYGDPNATQEEIERAARAAYAEEFINELTHGYETFVGEGGMQLSGGQRQRLAIARAFLKNAPIILLDEATSALDSESERIIQSALDNLLTGRTTLAIAHRLSTVINSDRIYVMQAGEIVESGKHTELLKEKGIYANLYKLQFEFEFNEDSHQCDNETGVNGSTVKNLALM